jgi:hypothetical protein
VAVENDCYKYKMDLVTNGVVNTDAINFVKKKKEELSKDSHIDLTIKKETNRQSYTV